MMEKKVTKKKADERFADAFERVANCMELQLEIQRSAMKSMLALIDSIKKREGL